MSKREQITKSVDYNLARLQVKIAQIVKQYMKSRNLSKTELADNLNCPDATVRELLSGDFNGTIDNLFSIMKSLGKMLVIDFVDNDSQY